MTDVEAGGPIESVDDLRPNSAILIGGGIAIGVVSTVWLPGPIAVASMVLGVLMIAGAGRFLRFALGLSSYTGNLPE